MIIIKQKKRFRKDLGDLTELKNSIKEIGLIHPIVKDSQGNLIAGARRLQACIELGIEPIYRIVDFTNPEKAEIDENTQRKDFSPSEKVEIKKWVNKELAKKGNQYIKKCSVQNLDKALKVKERPIDIAAKITNTSTETLNKLDKIFSSDNEEIKRKVDNNTISVDKGIQELKKIQQEEKNEKLKEKEVLPITGKYDVIIIDPAWDMKKIDREVAPNQVSFDYPTMSIKEIEEFKLPNEDNCHVFMWTTQKYLPNSFDIFKKWGVNYICCFVWHKNGGFQPFGLPQYNCEFVLYGRIGTPTFIDLKNFMTCFEAKRTGHSKKPDIFYQTVKRVTAGKRIDIFNRRKIEGFEVWGNEAN
jgi:ParB/RepB/Spo0J family partition protein